MQCPRRSRSNGTSEPPAASAYAGAPGPSSIQVEDEPTFARICALFGSFCVVVGGVALYIGLFTTKTLPWPFTPFWMSLLLTVGCIALLFHAAYDRHVEFRRVYQFLGLACLVGGAVLCFLPYSAGGNKGQAGDLLGAGCRLPVAGAGVAAVHAPQRDGSARP